MKITAVPCMIANYVDWQRFYSFYCADNMFIAHRILVILLELHVY